MQPSEILELSELPFDPSNAIDWFNQIGETYWSDCRELLWQFALQIIEEDALPLRPGSAVPLVPENGTWNRFSGGGWHPISLEELPILVVFDLESCKLEEDGHFFPFLAICFGNDLNFYGWATEPGTCELVPFPGNRIVIGHNIAAYDRTYLSCEYEYLDSNNHYVDTMGLATIVYGLGEDGKSNEMLTVWKLYKEMADAGKAVPLWFRHACTAGLKELTQFLLGIKIDKAVRDDLEEVLANKLYSVISPQNVLEYCIQDVWYTFRIFRELFTKIERQFFQSPCSWSGLLLCSKSKTFLGNWEEFISTNEGEFDQFSKSHRELIKGLAVKSYCAGEENSTVFDLDWTKSPQSRWAKINPTLAPWKWLIALEQKNFSLGLRDAVNLLELCWDGERIRYMAEGNKGAWCVLSGTKLPHPDGSDSNLGSPICTGYLPFAEAGRLTSEAIPQERLVSLLAETARMTQWKNYRSRYAAVRSQTTPWGRMVVTNVNPCGTVTRRATSNLWQVLPKETERKLGSNVMDYLVAPKGYSIVGGDFDAQELGLATVLTDAQVGVVNSSPWTEMILNGDKNLGTDNHSVVAKRFKIPRNPIAKNVNFCLQYGGGLEKIALTIYSGTNDKTYEECLVLAKEYMNFMKGSNGIAKTTFDTLKKYGGTGGIRTMVLGVRIPESLDALWAQKRFTTTRNNWLIQSAGQDMLHLFHVGLWAYSIEYDLDYYPMLNIHDAAYFFVKKGQEELFKKCCQSIHYRLKATIYQQARKQAISLLGYGELTPDFTTPEKQQWFSSIKVGSRLSEV